MIEWTYYHAEHWSTNQRLAERAQIVADALDEGLRVEYQTFRERTWRESHLALAAMLSHDIRIGREVPELECWMRRGGVGGNSARTYPDKSVVETWCSEYGGECVRMTPEEK